MTMKKIICLLMFTSLPALAADVSGTWKVDGSVANNPVTAICTFKQTDTHISGSCKMDSDQNLTVKGEVTDKQATWQYDLEHEGTTYTLTFTGTLDSETSMKGSIGVVPSDSEGDFSAKKQ
jgi:hypothetical protein